MPETHFFRQAFVPKTGRIQAKEIQDVAPRLPILLPFYLKELEPYKDSTRRKYLTETKKARLRDQVAFTQSLLKARLSLGHDKNMENELASCVSLLDALNPPVLPIQAPAENQALSEAEQQALLSVHNPIVAPAIAKMKYSAILFSHEMTSLYHDFPKKTSNFFNDLKSFLSMLNVDRLYWVWGGWFTSSMMDMFSSVSFGALPNAQSVYSYGAGYMSYYLYFIRFFCEDLALLRLVFRGPWMTDLESDYAAQTTRQDRFFDQFDQHFMSVPDQRKFLLANDFFWAIGNYISFIILTGKDLFPGSKIITLGDAGNYVNAALFLFDIIVSIWMYYRLEQQYESEMLRLDAELWLLHDKEQKNLISAINKKKRKGQLSPEEILELQSLEAQLRDNQQDIAELEKLIRNTELDWDSMRKDMMVSMYYSSMLFLAFSLSCTALFPAAMVSVHIAHICSVAGTSLCFGLTIGRDSYKGHLATQKSKAEATFLYQDATTLLAKFNLLRAKSGQKTEEEVLELTDLYLEIQGIMLEATTKEQLAPAMQAKQAIFSTAESIFPGLLMLTFMSLSTGAAAGVVVSVMAAFFIAYLLAIYFEKTLVQAPLPDPDQFIRSVHADLTLQHFTDNQKELKQPWYEREGYKNLLDGIKSCLQFIATVAFSPVLGLGLLLGAFAKLLIDASIPPEEQAIELSAI